MSWFSSSSSDGHHFNPPMAHLNPPNELFGPLEPVDTEWQHSNSNFATETQIWYFHTQDGVFGMIQIIHSAVGLWYPQIQFTFRLYDTRVSPPRSVWKSCNVNKFTCPPPGLDKRSAKSDIFSVTLDPKNPDTYVITGSYDSDVTVSLTATRVPGAPGFKLGAGPQGGMTYFGKPRASPNADKPGTVDTTSGDNGFVVHRFWPQTTCNGTLRVGNDVYTLEDDKCHGTFIHAIQGMRPNLVASRWNFAHYQSFDDGHNTSMTMMEFTTPQSYGHKKVNVGMVCVDGKLVTVTAGGDDGDKNGAVAALTTSTATHENTIVDPETSYKYPGNVAFHLKGPRCKDSGGQGDVDFKLNLPTRDEANKDIGLIEKVDVLAQIPYLVKKVVNVVSGTKPYIYTYQNKVDAEVTIDGETYKSNGYVFSEASFISEPEL